MGRLCPKGLGVALNNEDVEDVVPDGLHQACFCLCVWILACTTLSACHYKLLEREVRWNYKKKTKNCAVSPLCAYLHCSWTSLVLQHTVGEQVPSSPTTLKCTICHTHIYRVILVGTIVAKYFYTLKFHVT